MIKRKQFLVHTTRRERIRVTYLAGSMDGDRFCEKCGCDVEWITVREASVMLGTDPGFVRELIDSGKLDFRVYESECLLVCSNAVMTFGSSEDRIN